MSRYDELAAVLLSRLDDYLPLPDADIIERNGQRIAIAVHEALGMTPEHWATLTPAERVPWLENVLADRAGGDVPLDRLVSRADVARMVHLRKLKPRHTEGWGEPDEPGSGSRPERWMLRRIWPALVRQFGDRIKPLEPD